MFYPRRPPATPGHGDEAAGGWRQCTSGLLQAMTAPTRIVCLWASGGVYFPGAAGRTGPGMAVVRSLNWGDRDPAAAMVLEGHMPGAAEEEHVTRPPGTRPAATETRARA